jgi:hypothetical protein
MVINTQVLETLARLGVPSAVLMIADKVETEMVSIDRHMETNTQALAIISNACTQRTRDPPRL